MPKDDGLFKVTKGYDPNETISDKAQGQFKA